ncbi:MAG: GNAT family N-acetyltransferase [Burkholderiaceae bacterium]
MDVAAYIAFETLRDGRQVKIRALTPADRENWLDFISRTSDATRYRRFFGFKRDFSEEEIDYQVNVDLVSNVALVAGFELEDGREIGIGGARYIVTEPGRAEVSFLTDDAHQGLGVASLLIRHLILVARDAGIKTFDAEVLADNTPMLKVFQHCGLPMTFRQQSEVTLVTLTL